MQELLTNKERELKTLIENKSQLEHELERSKRLISGDNEQEIEELNKRARSLESDLILKDKELSRYKDIVSKLEEKFKALENSMSNRTRNRNAIHIDYDTDDESKKSIMSALKTLFNK